MSFDQMITSWADEVEKEESEENSSSDHETIKTDEQSKTDKTWKKDHQKEKQPFITFGKGLELERRLNISGLADTLQQQDVIDLQRLHDYKFVRVIKGTSKKDKDFEGETEKYVYILIPVIHNRYGDQILFRISKLEMIKASPKKKRQTKTHPPKFQQKINPLEIGNAFDLLVEE